MRVLAIAWLSVAEASRRRLVLAGSLVGGAFVALFVAGLALIEGRAAADAPASAFAATFLTLLGLYAVSFLTGLLAVFVGAGVVSGDLDTGTLHAVLARPLSRAGYLLGRWAGLAALLVAYAGGLAGCLLTAAWWLSGYNAVDPPAAVGFLALQALTLLSLALLGSTLLPTVTNGLIVLSLFGLSWLGGIVGGIGRTIGNEPMAAVATVLSVLVPSDTVWRAASYFAQSPLLAAAGDLPGMPLASSAPPAAGLLWWAAVYPVLLLAIAAVAFARRDL